MEFQRGWSRWEDGYRNCVAGSSLAEVSGILPTPLRWFSRYSRSVLHRRLRPHLRKPAALRIPDRGGCHALSPALGRSTHYCRLSASRLGGVPGAARRHPELAHHRDLDPEQRVGQLLPEPENRRAFAVSGSQCITETGSPAGDLSTGAAKPAILASAFCIPTTTNSTIDLGGRSPGPGATSLPGIAQVVPTPLTPSPLPGARPPISDERQGVATRP
jgi:hypothetical protein